MNIRRWLENRPNPTPTDRVARVEMTPPSDGPHSVSEFVEWVAEDVRAVLQNDPAARNAMEVVLVYPGLHALWAHRVSHALWKRGMILRPRVLAHASRILTGIEIHPAARIGRRVFIDHGMGIVVGETATIGDDCLIYKGALLGGTSLERTDRHPTLGSGVVVGSGACILGPIHIGDNAKVGSNSVVVRDVPANTTVVGVPARPAGRRSKQLLDHADLPDPMVKLMRDMMEEIEQLQCRIRKLEGVAESRDAAVEDPGPPCHE
jgi:serine O-acetyltransferase